MRDDRICPKCGQMIPRGTADCPICRKSVDFYLRRETLLLVSFAGTGLLFVITGLVVKWYHAREKRLGWQWYTQGETDLRQGKPVVALSEFRNALYHQPEDPGYQLRLTQALVAIGRLDEAQTYLSRMWEGDPANGPVNLELGLLAMKKNDVPHVITYFHSAIDGVWDGQHDPRRSMRLQLCEYLIDHGRRDEALAELTALSAETPDNADLRAQVGDVFLQINDYAVALKEYRQALHLNPAQPDALLGAGKAALALGDYRTASANLSRAVAENRSNTEAIKLLRVANQVLHIDPFDRRVSIRERRKRAVSAFQNALARLNECATAKGEDLNVSPPQTGMQRAYAAAIKMKPQANLDAFRRNPDLLDSEMNLVFGIERLTTSECGKPSSGVNQALLALAANYGGRE